MTGNKNSKEKDLKEAIENRTEDPDELLYPEDIDVDASDVEVEKKPETVAWYDEDKDAPFGEVLFSERWKKEYENLDVSGLDELIRRKDVLKLIEEMMDIDQMNPEMTDEALKKERLFTLRDLKQKIEDGEE